MRTSDVTVSTLVWNLNQDQLNGPYCRIFTCVCVCVRVHSTMMWSLTKNKNAKLTIQHLRHFILFFILIYQTFTSLVSTAVFPSHLLLLCKRCRGLSSWRSSKYVTTPFFFLSVSQQKVGLWTLDGNLIVVGVSFSFLSKVSPTWTEQLYSLALTCFILKGFVDTYILCQYFICELKAALP